jgi:hypothetical protein
MTLLCLSVDPRYASSPAHYNRLWFYDGPDASVWFLVIFSPSVAMLLRTYLAQERAVCCNPHNSSHWDPCVTRQLAYKRAFCQNVVSTNKLLRLIIL